MIALETYNFVAQRVAINFQLDIFFFRICYKVSPEMRVDTFTIYELPHGFSYRRLSGLSIQLAFLKALSRAHFPILGRVFLLISVGVETDAPSGPVQVPQVFALVVTIKHGECLGEIRVDFNALW